MNKKGSGLDILFTSISILAFAIIILLGYKVYDSINTELVNSDAFQAADIGDNAEDASVTILHHFPGVIDNTFLFLTVGLGIVAIVLAGLVRVHPIFFVFFILLLVIIIFLSAIFSNIYGEIAGNSEFTALADNLTFITILMNALPLIVGVFGTLLAIFMFKAYKEQEIV